MTDSNAFVAELLRIGVYLEREGARVARGFGLSQQQFVVLKTIQEKGPVSQKDIVSALLFEKSNVSKAVTVLMGKGLVATRRDEVDSRKVFCEVTLAGIAVIDECMCVFDRWNTEWLRGIPGKDLRYVMEVLRKLERKG